MSITFMIIYQVKNLYLLNYYIHYYQVDVKNLSKFLIQFNTLTVILRKK